MENFVKIDHPIARHKLSILRNKETKSLEFRQILNELSQLIAYEACRDLKLSQYDVETPVAKGVGEKIADDPIVMSIMRAGNGMLEGVLNLLPFASAGHIGIYRDKFIGNTVEYYFKLPENYKGRPFFILDPLVATGDTMLASLDRLQKYDHGGLKVFCVLASHQALEKIHHFHPEVKVYGLSIEEGMSDKGYLLPGIGDAGNRLYGIK